MVLHGWKQIAHYLGCGIRTAQRWEGQCGLPVNRPRNHPRSPVLAQSEALDSWAAGGHAAAPSAPEGKYQELEFQLLELKQQVALLAERIPELPRAGGHRDPAVSNRSRQLAAKAQTFEA